MLFYFKTYSRYYKILNVVIWLIRIVPLVKHKKYLSSLIKYFWINFSVENKITILYFYQEIIGSVRKLYVNNTCCVYFKSEYYNAY